MSSHGIVKQPDASADKLHKRGKAALALQALRLPDSKQLAHDPT